MVDLPSLPNSVPDVSPPTSRVTPADVASPYQHLADALNKGGEALNDTSKLLAEQAGYKAVTRDADGNLQFDKAPIFGDAALAYKRAVKVSALAEGEQDARRKDIAMRQEFHDNPQGYLTAADAYRTARQKQVTQDIGPEVGLAIGKAIDQQTTLTYKGLLNEKEKLDLGRATQAITSQILQSQQDMRALVLQGGAGTDQFKQLANQQRVLYGELVNNPRLAFPRERADYELNTFDTEMRAGAVAQHIAGPGGIYETEGAEAAMRATDELRTDPSLGLTPAAREVAYTQAVKAVQDRMRREDVAVKAVSGEFDAINKMLADGYTPPASHVAALQDHVAKLKNPALTDRWKETQASIQIVSNAQSMPPQEFERFLNSMDKQLRSDGATPQALQVERTGQQLLKNMRTQIAQDPLGWAGRVGVMETPPINFGDAAAPAQMRDRVARAESVAQHYGITPVYLRPEEKQALELAASKGGAPMLEVAQTIANGFGDRAPRVMAEISQNAPVLAHVGSILQNGGSQTFASNVAEGIAVRNESFKKAGERAFEVPNWIKDPSDKVLETWRPVAQEAYGDAFSLSPEKRQAAEASVHAAYSALAMRKGYSGDLGAGDGRKVFKQLLQESAGATFTTDGTQYGGTTSIRPGFWGITPYQTVVPPAVRASAFSDVIGAITDKDLATLPTRPQMSDGRLIGADYLKKAVPVAVKGGYRFAAGDPTSDDPKWIRGADGRPFVLDFDQMEPKLRQRVPNAFRGGGN